jgi:hypothetical protein
LHKEYIFLFTMKAEDLFDATVQLPAKKAIVKIIDLKIDNDMRDAMTRMEVMFDKVNARIDILSQRMDTLSQRIDDTNRRVDHLETTTHRRIDRMDNTMRWGFGIIITLMLAMKFFK